MYILLYSLCRWENESFVSVCKEKKHERKRWGYYPVRIPIKGGISVFKVSVPLGALSSDQRMALLAQPPSTQPPIRSSSTQTPLLNSLLSSSSEPVVTTCTYMYVYVNIYTCLYEYSGWLRLYKIFQEAASPVSDLRFMCHLLNNCSLYMSIIFIYFLSIYIGNN